ncbi:MAG: hypothetical protein KBH21_00555 [Acetoanaerobium sp.]|nr:hypothetical protein [Acetoanaerobium sp.]
MSKIFKYPFWIMVGLFIITIFIVSGIEKALNEKDTWIPALGIIPAMIVIYYIFIRPTLKNK